MMTQESDLHTRVSKLIHIDSADAEKEDILAKYTKTIVHTNLTKAEKDAIYPMYVQSYVELGLMFPEEKKYEMFTYYPEGVYTTENGQLTGALLYYSVKQGNKISLVFGRDRDTTKRCVIPILATLLSMKGWFAELSDGLEHIMRKYYEHENLTNMQTIQRILGTVEFDEDTKHYELTTVKLDGTGHYKRDIKGVGLHEKGLYGKPITLTTLKELGDAALFCIKIHKDNTPP